jgi:DNA-binding NtrC family response regulator
VSESTKTLAGRDQRRVGRWRIDVTAGPGRGVVLRLEQGAVRVGSSPSNQIVLEDARVSRHHLEIEAGPGGLRVRDLGSKNGTFYQGSRVDSLELPLVGGVLQLGDSELALRPDDAAAAVAPAPPPRDRCGRMVGRSPCMRELFALVERVAASSATVLIQGETGTGKELVAEALHELGPRQGGPFVVVDCGGVPHDLIESELYGHLRGAFTGATRDVQGAFQRAHRGTIFLDEIGELALDVQPKLLRALETGSVKPIGAAHPTDVDVRVVAATNRDLAADVKAGRFREDLFYRLSVVHVQVPPLRVRLEDLPLLADVFVRDLGAPPLGPQGLEVLAAHPWPGNVRQLRNVLDRAAAISGGGPLRLGAADLELPSARISPSALLGMPYKQAKDEMLARFTREYLEALLGRHGGNVSAAAREARIDRNWIVALARRHGVRVRE